MPILTHSVRKGALLFLLLLAVAGGLATALRPAKGIDGSTTTLAKVRQSKVLRCGYSLAPPLLVRNPATGEVTGIAATYLSRIAAAHGLTINWAEDLSGEQIATALNSGKIDAYCLPSAFSPEQAKHLTLAGGMGRLPLYLYVPSRSKMTLDDVKHGRFAVIDGSQQEGATIRLFPGAKRLGLSNGSSKAELYDQIRIGKSDAVVSDHASALAYMRDNPGIIRRFADEPLRTTALSYAVRKDDKDWADYVTAMTDVKRAENAAIFDDVLRNADLTGNPLIR